jgi:hypothetical protein
MSQRKRRIYVETATEAVWALLVVSDAGQADTLKDQRKWATETARLKGWTITRAFEGISSGNSGARPLAMRMLEELEALSPATRPLRVLMIRLERLGRGNGLEAMEAFLRIRRLGIVVHTRLDGDVGYDRASELLMPVLRFFIGGMENEVRRDKLNTNYAKRRKAHGADNTIALSNRPPYGLAYENGHYVPKDPEASAVRLAYELKAQGFGSHLIAKQLAPLAPPMTLRNGKVLPQHWTPDRVRRMIMKSAYRGLVVDEALWYRAQRHAREVQRPTIRHEYALGGALVCECGYALVGHGGPGKLKNPDFRYYQCRNYAAHGGRMKHHRTNRIEEQFVALLLRLRAEESLLRRFVDSNNISGEGAKTIRARITALRLEIETGIERRRKLFEAFEQGPLKKKDLQWRLDDLTTANEKREADIARLEDELLIATSTQQEIENVRLLVERAADLWSGAANDDKRALAKAVGNALGGLYVTNDGQLLIGTRKKS